MFEVEPGPRVDPEQKVALIYVLKSGYSQMTQMAQLRQSRAKVLSYCQGTSELVRIRPHRKSCSP